MLIQEKPLQHWIDDLVSVYIMASMFSEEFKNLHGDHVRLKV
jgi:hypothetical protein